MATRRKRRGGRVACIDLPAIALQILLRDRPDFRRYPAAVVAEDLPSAPLLCLSPLAERAHLRAGMRYGAARDLVPSLRAAPVPRERITATIEELVRSLQTFSPRIEADAERPGTFYADPSGLSRIYGGHRSWAVAVSEYLKGRGFRSSVVVGFERFESFAVVRTKPGVRVLASREEARELLWEVPLAALGVSPKLRDDLALLGVTTVGDLVSLPSASLHARYGPEASALHALAADPQMPLQPRAIDEPVRVTAEIDPPDADHARLLFAIKGALHALVQQVTTRCEVLSAVELELTLETRPSQVRRERIEPAEPTRDAMLLIDLIRLRLNDATLAAPIEGIALTAVTAPPSGQQLVLFGLTAGYDRRAKRDAGDRALARVRAAFGPRSVSKARLRDAHLPEAGFSWDGVRSMPKVARHKEVRSRSAPALVRRVLTRPKALPPRDRDDPTAGPRIDGGRALLRLYGPYRVSGGWWVRTVERDYYYGETDRGDLLWLYFDRPRQRWFLQGVVD